MRQVIVVASTWVRGEKGNQKCVAITLDQQSAIILLGVLDSLGPHELRLKLISGITEHTQESC